MSESLRYIGLGKTGPRVAAPRIWNIFIGASANWDRHIVHCRPYEQYSVDGSSELDLTMIHTIKSRKRRVCQTNAKSKMAHRIDKGARHLILFRKKTCRFGDSGGTLGRNWATGKLIIVLKFVPTPGDPQAEIVRASSEGYVRDWSNPRAD